ncbi:oligopeptide transport system permease protein [Spiroplasma chinense]|uniref:Oligopeptide transport system permease protein n=1 Tax=Spiroplasma chinense TaxID=216932 RepID=A0A5B9Y4Y0_9MOLU|nr:oligopeptide ABC transporter permease OppB [Spiroplasma chinense]QEH62101.1 oligopeptide transport system permease protein [Spiroplasma chinense]
MNTEQKSSSGDLELLELLEQTSLSDEVSSVKKGRFEKLKFNLSKSSHAYGEFMRKAPMLGYSLRRIIYAFITLYIAMAVVYVMLRIVTTDAAFISDINLEKAHIIYGDERYLKLISDRTRMFGVSGSMTSQVLRYLSNITPLWPKKVVINPGIDPDTAQLTGETVTKWFYLGVFMNGSSGGTQLSLVQDAFKRSIPVSFKVGGISVLLSYLIGVPLGILSAKNKEKSVDSAINGTSLIISAIPALVLISLLYKLSIYVFGSGGTYSDLTVVQKVWPILGVMLLVMPMVIVNTRRYVVDEMTSDYTKFALSKGLSTQYVFYVHIFRNAGIRLVKTLPEIFVLTLFGSSILVEQHWSIDGMSKFILKGVANKDTFVVLGYIFVSASAGVFSSLVGDLLLATLDPRIKLTK